MSPYIWLGVWFLMLAGSVAAHEAGHLVVGRRYGWDYAGFTMRLTGPKVLLGHSSPRREDWNLGRVALAGPLATLVACVIFIGLAHLPIENAWIFESLAAANFTIFVLNLLPLPITDGGHILYAVTGWRMSWGRAAAGWIAVEVLIVLGLALRALLGELDPRSSIRTWRGELGSVAAHLHDEAVADEPRRVALCPQPCAKPRRSGALHILDGIPL